MPPTAAVLTDGEFQALLSFYLPILREYVIKRYRVSEDQAADWVQGFVLEKILAQNLIVQADRKRSRLRTFLLRCLDNYVIQQIRVQTARKRRPREGFLRLDELAEEDMPAASERNEESFDLAWAQEVFGRCLMRMRQYCLDIQRLDIWGVFEARILRPLIEQSEPPPYKDLVKRFSLRSRTQASNLLISAQRIFARCLRTLIEEHAASQHEIELEIRELKAVLFRSGLRLINGEAAAWLSPTNESLGQREMESSALPQLALQPDSAAVRLDDVFDNGQP